MILNIVDLITLIIAVAGAVYSVETWRRVQAPSRMLFAVSFVFLMLQRATIWMAELTPHHLVTDWMTHNRTIIAAPSQVLLTASAYVLFRELSFFHFDVREHKESHPMDDTHPDCAPPASPD